MSSIEPSEVLLYNLRRLQRNPFFLLVEDSPEDMQLIIKELNCYFEKCWLLTARTADEALTVLSNLKADAVFLDLRLPGMDGIELIDQIHARYSTSIIVVTGVDKESELVIEALKHGVVNIINKPMTRIDLERIFKPK